MDPPNLSGSFLIDFGILVSFSDQFLKDFAEKAAGKKPPPQALLNSKGKIPIGTNVILIIKNNFPIRTLLQSAISSSGLNQIKVAQGQTGTFPIKYIDLDTWQNQFFIIRSQLVGLPPPYNFAVTIMDDVWNKILQVSGQWKASVPR